MRVTDGETRGAGCAGSSSACAPSPGATRSSTVASSAAAITLYGFFALFALCVLAVAIVGIVATGNDHVAEDIVSWLGLHGDAAKTVIDAVNTAQHSAKVASVVGVVGLVWVGSSLAVAVASAYDVAWGVPSRVTRARVVGLGWLAGSGVLLALGSFVTAGFAALPALVAPLVLAAQPGRQHGAVALDVVDPPQPPAAAVAGAPARRRSSARSGSRC